MTRVTRVFPKCPAYITLEVPVHDGRHVAVQVQQAWRAVVENGGQRVPHNSCKNIGGRPGQRMLEHRVYTWGMGGATHLPGFGKPSASARFRS